MYKALFRGHINKQSHHNQLFFEEWEPNQTATGNQQFQKDCCRHHQSFLIYYPAHQKPDVIIIRSGYCLYPENILVTKIDVCKHIEIFIQQYNS